MTDQPEHISTTDARAGSTPNMTRHVLFASLAIVGIAYLIILLVAG